MNGEVVKPLDSLRIQGNDKETWFARLEEARQCDGQVWALVTWWYTNNDLPANLRMPEIREPCELIESNHYDIVSSESIRSTAKVDRICEKDDGREVNVPSYGFLTRQKYDYRRKRLTVSRTMIRDNFSLIWIEAPTLLRL